MTRTGLNPLPSGLGYTSNLSCWGLTWWKQELCLWEGCGGRPQDTCQLTPAQPFLVALLT